MLLSLVLVAGAVAGGLALHRSSADDVNRAGVTPSQPIGSPEVDETARTAGVNKFLVRRSQAVGQNDLTQFLRDVDPTDELLVARQKQLFTNLRQFGFQSLRYDQLSEQFDQRLVDKYGPSTYLVGVAMTYQIKGIDPQPVRTMLGYTFSQKADGGWLLRSDSDMDRLLPRGSHQEAWDLGEILVKRAPRVLVVVERDQNKLANGLVAKALSAVQAVSKSWPGGWTGSGVVIALDDKIVRGADYTVPKNAEDALAMATWVYRTLPGEKAALGERADSYVVVNPRNRAKVDARTLAHEFTHVATAPYGAFAPRWLVEGAAAYVEFLPMEGEKDLALDKYRNEVRAKYLAKVRSLPADGVFFKNSIVSYPMSWLAVDHLFTKYGGVEVGTLYQEMAALGTTQAERNRIMLEHLGITEAGLFVELRRAAVTP
ncbi:hypothetical protein [Kribbella sp. CA-293567]|uniref:hypothetical protein n=1 Tax=Kribbella sp. CA-293567 TaxID=3002436 RepID=UPI0022DE3B29|nr:hypothetical protein [Kribbella sp. CA-293567]WBQ02233.1 hypothetical protein OX958_19820 [Kribbella sp. CA-293567]